MLIAQGVIKSGLACKELICSVHSGTALKTRRPERRDPVPQQTVAARLRLGSLREQLVQVAWLKLRRPRCFELLEGRPD